MPELSMLQEARLMELARQVKVAVDELREAAATSLMHDAKCMVRRLYLEAKEDDVLPLLGRQELVESLEAAWRQAVSGGQLFERTHGAMTFLDQAEKHISFLLARGVRP